MRPRIADLLAHGARAAVSAAALALLPTYFAPVAAAGLFLAIFVLVHDLAHGALGLPRRINELALAAGGVLIVTSGHGMRLVHLRHHARTLTDDDLEGTSARMGFLEACAAAPRLALAARVRGFMDARPRERRWQAAEHVACAALAVTALVGPAWLGVYLAVALIAQVAAPVWAGHVPHRMPAWMVRAARAVAATGSVTALSLGYHDLHHARPKVPTFALARVAQEVSETR